MYSHSGEGITPSAVRNDQMDVIGFNRERLKAGKFERRVAGKRCWVPDI